MAHATAHSTPLLPFGQPDQLQGCDRRVSSLQGDFDTEDLSDMQMNSDVIGE